MGRATYSGRYRLSPAIFTRKSLRGSSGQVLDGDASGDASATGGLGIAKNLAGGATGIATASADATVGGLPSFSPGPSISGSATVGVAKSYTPGTVNGFPTPTVTRQWLRNGVAISGATNATYTPVTADIGTNTLSVRETATNTYGTVSSTSSPVSVSAASGTNPNDRYVRAGASPGGNGLSWSTAWQTPNSASSLAAGATVWLAGGTYNGGWTCNFDNVTYKKATIEAHGTNTGWLDSYDTQVLIIGSIFFGFSVRTGITIDGAKRDTLTAGYGIRMWGTNDNGDGESGIKATGGVPCHNLTVRYCDMGHPTTAQKFGEDCIQGKGDGLIVEDCYIHDSDVRPHPESSDGVAHSDGIQWFEGSNIIVRRNFFRHNGQHITMCWDENDPTTISNVEISYNVFDNIATGSTGGAATAINLGGSSNSGTPQAFVSNARVYNNTFFVGTTDYVIFPNNQAANITFRNNALYSSRGQEVGPTNNSDNAWDNSGAGACATIPTGEPGQQVAADLGFVDAANGNYELVPGAAIRNTGVYLGLTTDILGRAVPQSGSGVLPHKGAFQTP